MKWLTLSAPLFLGACGAYSSQLYPYSATGAAALRQDEASCATRFAQADDQLNCLRKLASNDGYWLLIGGDGLKFVARPARYQPPPTLFKTGARMKADIESKAATGSQPVDIAGTWNFARFLAIPRRGGTAGFLGTCTLQQTGNELTGFCDSASGGEGPIVGSVDGPNVGWRWLHNSGNGNNFLVGLFAGTVNPDGELEGIFDQYSTYNILEPTFDIKYTHPPDFRLGAGFRADKLPAKPA